MCTTNSSRTGHDYVRARIRVGGGRASVLVGTARARRCARALLSAHVLGELGWLGAMKGRRSHALQRARCQHPSRVWWRGGQVVWRCGGVAAKRCGDAMMWWCGGGVVVWWQRSMVAQWCGGGVAVWWCGGVLTKVCGGAIVAWWRGGVRAQTRGRRCRRARRTGSGSGDRPRGRAGSAPGHHRMVAVGVSHDAPQPNQTQHHTMCHTIGVATAWRRGPGNLPGTVQPGSCKRPSAPKPSNTTRVACLPPRMVL